MENDGCIFRQVSETEHMLVLGKAAGSRFLGKYHGMATKVELEDLLVRLERSVQSKSNITLENLVVKTGKISGQKVSHVVEPAEGAVILPPLRAYLQMVESGTAPRYEDDPAEDPGFSLN